MTVYEIVMGVILLICACALIFLTLCQHTKGQGIAGVISGNTNAMGGDRISPADRMLARFTAIAGVVLFVVAFVACVVCSRLG